MKVEVIEMRRNGAKVAVNEHTRRHVGYLQIFPYSNPRTGGERMMIAALFPRPEAYTEFVLEELEGVTIGNLRNGKFMLSGLQNMRRGKKIYATWPQVWFCRVLFDEDAERPAPSAADPWPVPARGKSEP